MTAPAAYLLGVASTLAIFGAWRAIEWAHDWLGRNEVFVYPTGNDPDVDAFGWQGAENGEIRKRALE